MTEQYPDEPDLELDPTYVLDDDQYADPDQEDIGTDDPYADGDEEDDSILSDDEIDELPDVGEVDLNEEPILDELDEEESSG